MPTADNPTISDYALIGDCHGTALVRRDGAIDWACLRRFDSSPSFGRLLDPEGGTFVFEPALLESTSRRYLPDTNVLETTFVTRSGILRLLDAFTMRPDGHRHPYHQLIRVVECSAGSVDLAVAILPRFDYGSVHPRLQREEPSETFTAVGGDQALLVWSDVALEIDREDCALRGRVAVKQGERRRFSIVAEAPELLHPETLEAAEIDRRLEATADWWREWSARGTPPERYREPVKRSALLLKLLTCAPTGAIVAAPTTSLPETLGGVRNWDYRYAWIRDSSMTMSALLSIGHDEVAKGFRRFLERSSAGSATELQVVYGCHGERRIEEAELPGLAGFRGSRPVRIGNQAHRQVQLDVYGEILTAASLDHEANPIDDEGWRFLVSVVEEAVRRWREKDNGIWESRGPPRHYVHSKAMCWRAIDRGIALADKLGRAIDLPHWRAERDAVRASIEKHGIDGDRGCFVHAYGSKDVDSSLLRLALIGFVPPDDPRFVATVAAIRKDLGVGPFLRRYLPEKVSDGLEGQDAGFLLCAFWLVDVLAMQDRMAEAETLFDQLLGHANEVGLLPEEIDPRTGEFLGNFPQAFSHMAIINAAQQLQRGRPAAHRALPVSERHVPTAK